MEVHPDLVTPPDRFVQGLSLLVVTVRSQVSHEPGTLGLIKIDQLERSTDTAFAGWRPFRGGPGRGTRCEFQPAASTIRLVKQRLRRHQPGVRGNDTLNEPRRGLEVLHSGGVCHVERARSTHEDTKMTRFPSPVRVAILPASSSSYGQSRPRARERG